MRFALKTLVISAVLALFSASVFAQENEVAVPSNGLEKERFRVDVNAGMGRLWFKEAKNQTEFQKNYDDRIRGGTALDGGITYYPTEHFGVGVKLGAFFTNYTVGNTTVTYADSTQAIGDVGDNIKLYFYGLNLAYRYRSVSIPGNVLHLSAAVGYTMYVNNAIAVFPVKLSGETPGVCGTLGYDVMITKHLSAGANASLWFGMLKKVKVEAGDESETIELSKDAGDLFRGTLSFGLRYSL